MTVNPALILSVQSLIVKKWKWVIISSPHYAQTCYIWHSVFIGTSPCSAFSFTLSSLLPFPFPPPPTSPLHFFPAPFPLLPSFLPLFAFLLPWFTFSANFYPFFVKLLFPHFLYYVCLIAEESRERKARQRKKGGGEVTHHVDQQLSGKYDFLLTSRLCAFLQINTPKNVVELWFNIRLKHLFICQTQCQKNKSCFIPPMFTFANDSLHLCCWAEIKFHQRAF